MKKSLAAKNQRSKVPVSAVLKAAIVPVAVLASAAFVVGGSNAAFTGNTKVTGNSAKAATIKLSNNKASLFSGILFQPGTTNSRCVTITNDGDVPVTPNLFGANPVDTKDLSSQLDLNIVEGNSGVDDGTTCTGFQFQANTYSGTWSNFLSKKYDYATGVPTATIQPGQSKQYMLQVSLKPSAPDSVQGGTTGGDFVWEVK